MGKKIREKISVTNAFYLVLAACIVVVLLSFLLTTTNLYDNSVEGTREEITPVRVEQINNHFTNYFFTEGQIDDRNSSLMFCTSHRNISVYADNVLIYERKSSNSIFGRTTGTVYNIVEIPADCSRLKVTLDTVYTSSEGDPITFYQGNGITMFSGVLRNSMFASGISLFNIVLGICMLIYWSIVRNRTGIGKELLYLGIFALTMGFWSFGETDCAKLIIENREAASFQAFVCLMLMGLPFVFFIKNFLKMKNDHIYKWYAIVNITAICVMFFLHFTGIAEVKETVFVSHILLVLAICYFAYALICKIRLGTDRRRVRVSVIGILILISSTVGDLVMYYQGAEQVDAFGRVGFMVYSIPLGLEAASDSLRKIEEGRKSEIYKELAVTDILTQTYNRNAYHDDTIGRSDLKNIVLVTFDLNNLKQCNDTFGHATGDRYIKDAVKIIRRVYGKHGKIYRIGGDEFCVLMENVKLLTVTRLAHEMEREEILYHTPEQDIRMEIACGYAAFDPTLDEDLEDTRSRADVMMYENKQKIKEQRKEA